MKNIYLIVGPSEGVKVIGLFAAEEVCKRRMRARGDSKEAVCERVEQESRQRASRTRQNRVRPGTPYRIEPENLRTLWSTGMLRCCFSQQFRFS